MSKQKGRRNIKKQKKEKGKEVITIETIKKS